VFAVGSREEGGPVIASPRGTNRPGGDDGGLVEAWPASLTVHSLRTHRQGILGDGRARGFGLAPAPAPLGLGLGLRDGAFAFGLAPLGLGLGLGSHNLERRHRGLRGCS